NASVDHSGSGDPLSSLRNDSLLRLTGVCLVQRDPRDESPQSFQLLLRGPEDVEVLRDASWWTRERTVAGAGWMGAAILFSGAWIGILKRRVKRQTETIHKKLENEAALKHAAESANR